MNLGINIHWTNSPYPIGFKKKNGLTVQLPLGVLMVQPNVSIDGLGGVSKVEFDTEVDRLDQAIADISTGGGDVTKAYVDYEILSVRGEVSNKADKSYVDGEVFSLSQVVSGKADKVYVDDTFNQIITEISPILQGKADKSYVDALHNELSNSKASVVYVDSKDTQINNRVDSLDLVVSSKVDANYVESVVGNKATVAYVDSQDQAIVNNLTPIINGKASIDFVGQNTSEIYSVVGLKADKTYVDTQNANLAINISLKTSKGYVDQQDNALSGRIDQKADANAVAQSLSLKADLIDGKIPESQLPSVVDDVLMGHYVNTTSFNDENNSTYTPESGKIYVDVSSNKTYRWTGSSYVQIGGGDIVLGETSATAYRGDRGKIAYDHSLSSGNPHNSTTSDIPEGVNLYHTDPRVRMTQLTGINITSTSQLVATDYLIVALGKLQGQINTKTALSLGETVSDAYRGDRGKVAYDHSQTTGNPHNTVTGQISETTNLWFTESRVLNSVLSGIVFSNVSAVTQTDTVVQAVGKLQAQVNTKTSLILGTTSTTAMAGNTNTSGISEGSNLYFTNARSIASPLSGIATTNNVAVSASDSIVDGIGKLQAQVNTKTSLTLGNTSTTALAGNSTTTAVAEGTNLYYTDARAKAATLAAPLTGLSVATGGAIVATDTVLAAMGKLQNQVTNSVGGGASSPTWVDITTIGTVAAYVTPVSIQVAKFQGMLWIRGTFNVKISVAVDSELFRISTLGAAYKPYAYSTAGAARLLMLISSYNLNTASQKFIGFSALGNITNSTQAASVDVVFEAKTALSTTDGTLNIPPTIIGTLAI